VISDEDKCICEFKWAQTRRKGDLRGFVHDAVVEIPAREKGAKRWCGHKCQKSMSRRELRTGRWINTLWPQQAETLTAPPVVQPSLPSVGH